MGIAQLAIPILFMPQPLGNTFLKSNLQDL